MNNDNYTMSSDQSKSLYTHLEEYIKQGRKVIPFRYQSKKRLLNGSGNLDVVNIQQYFSNEPRNIGIELGAASGGLIDIDLDCPQAIALAPYFLPITKRFGRQSAPASHWIFTATNNKRGSGGPDGLKTHQFMNPDPTENNEHHTLVELRANSAVTVFPGSVHESGEPIEWVNRADPIEQVDYGEILEKVQKLAAATYLCRKWDSVPSRDELAAVLCGVLLRNEWCEEEVDWFITTIADTAGDEEALSKRAKAKQINRQLEAGTGRVYGFPKLKELIGEQGSQTISEWLNLKSTPKTQELVDKFNETYFVSIEGGKTLVFEEKHDPVLRRRGLERMSPANFKAFWCNRNLTLGNKVYKQGDFWFENPHRRQYQAIVFAPNKEIEGCYNLWQGFGVEPEEGDWGLMHHHIKEVICDNDEESYQYIMGWMAYTVQHPDKLPEVAVVLQGGRGTGKGTFGREFGKLFGQHFIHITHHNHLVGNFNAHRRDCILMFVDEAFWAADKSGAKVLQTMITEPSFTLEAKYQDAGMAPSYLHMIIASNDDWVIPAATDERRYCVLRINDKYAQDTTYFAALMSQLDNGGREAMLYDLLHYDIGTFNVRKPPQTQALREQKQESWPAFEQWWFDILKQGYFFDYQTESDWGIVRTDSLYNNFIEAARRKGDKAGVRMTQDGFGKKLVKYLPEGWKYKRKITVTRRTLVEEWEEDAEGTCSLGKQKYHYEFPKIRIARMVFAERIGLGEYPWPPQVEDLFDNPLGKDMEEQV